MKDIKVVFMGTPEFATSILKVLNELTNVVLVVTQPDKLVGRKQELKYSDIKKQALSYNIEVFQPTKIKEDYQKIIDVNPDLIVTCAYGQIIPKQLLDLPRLGCINVHASLLPKYRGGAPIHKAIIEGEETTGITIMYMDESMDTGDIISKKECKIEYTDNVGTLHDKLSNLGANLLRETLPSIVNQTNTRTKQNDEEATYAWTIKREEEHLNFNDTAINIYNHIRGLYPFPTSYTIMNEIEVKVLDSVIGESSSNLSPGTIISLDKRGIGVATKDKDIFITKVKPFCKKEMLASDYINGLNKEKVLNTIME